MEEDKIRKIKLFNERVNRLKENVDFFNDLSMNINAKKDEKVNFKQKGPDKKTIKAFLLDFRVFMLNDEPVNFNHICNLVEKEVTDNELKEKTRKVRDSWNKLLGRKKGNKGNIVLKVNNKEFLPEEILKTWINSDYFHLNKEGRNLLGESEKSSVGIFSHFILLDLLQRLTALLFWFNENVIEVLIKQINIKN